MLRRWNILQEDNEYDTPIFSLLRKRVKSPSSGREGDFFTLSTGNWVNVIALTEKREVVLVSQYRHGIDQISLEIPGGCIDAEDPSPMFAAQRELQEETGYVSNNWSYLGKSSANPAILSNYCYFFLADQCSKSKETKHDFYEEIEISLLPESTFLSKVKEGEIHHSLAVAAVALWQLQ